MFNFYENEQLKKLLLLRDKKQFSKTIQSFSNEKSINYEEIYLDNTFGKGDKRKKIISEIAKCVSSNKENPIKNPDNLINILYIGDIINRLKYAIDNSTGVGTSALLEKNHMFCHPYTIFYLLTTKQIKRGGRFASKSKELLYE